MQWLGPHLSEISRRCGQLAQTRWPWVLAMLILAIQGLVEYAGGVARLPDIYLALGLRREAVMSGSLWQVLTYACLHGNGWHALINALCVLILGSRVEHLLGRGGFLTTMAVGVAGGALGHLLLADGGSQAFPLVGISGACVALLLVITTLSPQSRMFPLPVSGRSLGLGILSAALLLALVNPKLGLPGLAQIGRMLVAHGQGSWFAMGHACHLGGGVAGWLYGRWILRPGITLQRLRSQRDRNEAKQRGR
jgi:membrane associated rhomboid family serine protease